MDDVTTMLDLLQDLGDALDAAYLLTGDWDKAMDKILSHLPRLVIRAKRDAAEAVAEAEELGRMHPLSEVRIRAIAEQTRQNLLRLARESGDVMLAAKLSAPGWVDQIIAERSR